MSLKEHEIIAYVSTHLMSNENAEIESIALKKKSYRDLVCSHLINSSVNRGKIDSIKFKTTGDDIVAYYQFNTGKRQRKMIIEAKGGNVFYNFYTSIGQFICGKKSPSTYYWFGFAFPFSWRKKIRKYLKNDGEINPLIKLLIKEYTKNGQGLWFYFVKSNGEIIKETWNQTLTKNE